MKNTLYHGDNLDVLREHIPDESVDLIYLDPPSLPGKTKLFSILKEPSYLSETYG